MLDFSHFCHAFHRTLKMILPYRVQHCVETVFNPIFIDFMTFFYEPTWFSTATLGLCSVTLKMCCWDNGVFLRVKALSVRQPQNDTQPCENALSRTSSDMLHHCSTFVSPESRMWSLPFFPSALRAQLSGHVCQISHQWSRFSTSNSTAYLHCAIALHRFVMKCFIYRERSTRLQLKPLWLLSKNCPSGEKKKIIAL